MKNLFALILLVSTLAACTTKPTNLKDEAAFWTRADVSSALYMRGPKAQHQLHKDIASCVSEVKELSRLGSIRNANPPTGIEMNANLARRWQSPKGDGPLHTEFMDFNDFESCMNFKGWKRTNYVGQDKINNAQSTYKTTILGGTQNSDSDDSNMNRPRSGRATASGSFNN